MVRAHPITFVKQHPLGFVLSALTGMVVGPWALTTAQNLTGVGVRLPSVGNGG